MFQWLRDKLSPPPGQTPVEPPPRDPSGLNVRPDGTEVHLALYKYNTCVYCRRVMRVLENLEHIHVEMRDTRRDPHRRQELRGLTGRTQVPCLFIDDEPLFESADIIAWLKRF